MDNITTPETLPEAPQLSAADGGGADTAHIALDEVAKVLGKEFKDPETALKSIKDTYSYVGSQAKYKETVSKVASALNTDEQGVLQALEKLMETQNQPQPQAEAFITKEQYQEDIFFSKNPQLEDVRDILTPLQKSSGKSWNEFVGTDQAKKVIDSFVGYKEAQAKRSVLESSPRLGVASDKLSEAQKLVVEAAQAQQQGDVWTAQRAQQAAKENAVNSVLEAYEMK